MVMFNVYLQIFLFRKKDLRIKWLSNKLQDTKELVEQKTKVEQTVIKDIPIGIILYDNEYEIKWANDYAKDLFENVLVGRNIETISIEIYNKLIDTKPMDLFVTKIYTEEYEVNIDTENKVVYFTNVTEREEINRRYDASTDVIAVFNLDNLDDAMSVLDVSERSYLQGRYLEVLEFWADEYGFYIMPVTNSKLIAFMQKENLEELIEDDFKIMDQITSISKENDLLVTLSAGIACANIKLSKLGDIAQDALDLALSRGGGQIVVNIEGNDLQYFGGNTNTAEKRTRITTRINTQKLERLLEDNNRVFIMPHKHPDSDAFGAAMGLLKLAHAFDKETYIIIDRDDVDKTVSKIIQMVEYEYVQFLDYIISPSKALDTINREDLLIVVDHHSFGQTVDERIVLRTNKLVIIDHHRKLSDAIQNALISHIEPYASSSVELVTEMISLCSREIELNQFEATVMLSGIVVDTNNYMYRTGTRTFEASAILRKHGADTFKVKTILREGLEEIQLKSQLLSLAEVVHKRFSIVLVPSTIHSSRNLLAKMADVLLEIEDTVAAFAIGTIEEKVIAISARSLEGFNVQIIMEKFGGGGHLNNAGAQLTNMDIKEVRLQLIKILNEAVQEEKPMKVILIKDLKGRGKKGDVIEVATGYANFLLSNKTAIEATSENLQSIESERAKKEEQERKLLEEMKELRDKVEQLPVKVFVKIGENGKLYGKITTKQIADEYKKQHNIDIDKRKIVMKSNISSLGNYTVLVKLHRDVEAKLEVLVVEE